jgi:hypothetical protein
VSVVPCDELEQRHAQLLDGLDGRRMSQLWGSVTSFHFSGFDRILLRALSIAFKLMMWLWLWSCGRQAPAIRSVANRPGMPGAHGRKNSSRLGPALRAACKRRSGLRHFASDAAEVVAPVSDGWRTLRSTVHDTEFSASMPARPTDRHQHLGFPGATDRGDAVSDPAHSVRPRLGILCRKGAAAADRLGNQIPPPSSRVHRT